MKRSHVFTQGTYKNHSLSFIAPIIIILYVRGPLVPILSKSPLFVFYPSQIHPRN